MSRIEQLQLFLKDSPDDSFLVHALALEYLKAGDEIKAKYYFEQNLHKAPQYVATYYHLGKLLERSGATREKQYTSTTWVWNRQRRPATTMP